MHASMHTYIYTDMCTITQKLLYTYIQHMYIHIYMFVCKRTHKVLIRCSKQRDFKRKHEASATVPCNNLHDAIAFVASAVKVLSAPEP